MDCPFGVTAMRWGVAVFALSLLKVSPEDFPQNAEAYVYV